jgi:hypothetical protein
LCRWNAPQDDLLLHLEKGEGIDQTDPQICIS